MSDTPFHHMATDKKREEIKRDRCWNPQERWRVIQETINWAEQQNTVHRNDPATCLAEQRKKARPWPA
jgi:hypothetical protein